MLQRRKAKKHSPTIVHRRCHPSSASSASGSVDNDEACEGARPWLGAPFVAALALAVPFVLTEEPFEASSTPEWAPFVAAGPSLVTLAPEVATASGSADVVRASDSFSGIKAARAQDLDVS